MCRINPVGHLLAIWELDQQENVFKSAAFFVSIIFQVFHVGCLKNSFILYLLDIKKLCKQWHLIWTLKASCKNYRIKPLIFVVILHDSDALNLSLCSRWMHLQINISCSKAELIYLFCKDQICICKSKYSLWALSYQQKYAGMYTKIIILTATSPIQPRRSKSWWNRSDPSASIKMFSFDVANCRLKWFADSFHTYVKHLHKCFQNYGLYLPEKLVPCINIWF